MKNEAVQKFWEDFCEVSNTDVQTSFQIWYFGLDKKDAEELSELVLQGKKRATASLIWEYESNPQDAPILDGFSVVTDFEGNPKCVVQTTELRVVPFNEVDAEFAFDEGEGNQSLDYWRQIHWDYFSRRCAAIGKNPDLEMPVNCERFKLLYS